MAYHLECAQQYEFDDATADDIRRAMADDAQRGEYIILTSEDGSFLQAGGEGDGPYLIAHHDEPNKQNYLAEEDLSRDDVEAALLSFLQNDRAWWDDYTWHEVKHGFSIHFYLGIACLILAVFFGILAYTFW